MQRDDFERFQLENDILLARGELLRAVDDMRLAADDLQMLEDAWEARWGTSQQY